MKTLCNLVGNYGVYTFTHTFLFITDNNIKAFMHYYRSTFPHATVLPKMHILEEHVITWLKRWHVGFGLMGEQGAESIHAYFNSLARTYHSIPNRVERLRSMMREHFLHSAPHLVTAQPQIKRRKKEIEE